MQPHVKNLIKRFRRLRQRAKHGIITHKETYALWAIDKRLATVLPKWHRNFNTVDDILKLQHNNLQSNGGNHAAKKDF